MSRGPSHRDDPRGCPAMGGTFPAYVAARASSRRDREPRMKWLRRMLRVVRGTLLILCLAVVVLWVRSYWRMDQASRKVASKGAVTSTVEIRFAWSQRG